MSRIATRPDDWGLADMPGAPFLRCDDCGREMDFDFADLSREYTGSIYCERCIHAFSSNVGEDEWDELAREAARRVRKEQSNAGK